MQRVLIVNWKSDKSCNEELHKLFEQLQQGPFSHSIIYNENEIYHKTSQNPASEIVYDTLLELTECFLDFTHQDGKYLIFYFFHFFPRITTSLFGLNVYRILQRFLVYSESRYI
jgi:hypothetical protein